MARRLFGTMSVRDFHSGLNLRDAQGQLQDSETPFAWNATLDERGGVAKRLGYQKWNTTPYNSAAINSIYYSAAANTLIVKSGTDLFSGVSSVARKTFTTTDRVGFADFNNYVYAIHPIDGLWRSKDGMVWELVADAPNGSTICAWQNRLVSAGDPIHKYRLSACAIGDPTDWTTTAGHGWFNNVQEKDSQPIVCVAGAPGVDIAGAPGLLVFKRRSTYRVFDANDGSYQTLDGLVGAASAVSVVTYQGTTIVLSERGIFTTDGTQRLQAVGSLEEPLWRPNQVAYDKLDNWCAGVSGDHIKFSLTRTGESVNDLALEFHPAVGWVTPGSNAMSGYAAYGRYTDKMLGSSPTVTGQVYALDQTGSDDGTEIYSVFQSKFFEPAAGRNARLRHLRLLSRGDFTLDIRPDYKFGETLSFPVTNHTLDGVPYGDADTIYGDSDTVYAHGRWHETSDFYSLGVAYAVSFRIEETSSNVSLKPQLLEAGRAPVAGAWALYGIDLAFVQLEVD